MTGAVDSVQRGMSLTNELGVGGDGGEWWSKIECDATKHAQTLAARGHVVSIFGLNREAGTSYFILTPVSSFF
jgi:hypothetical protein